MFTGLVEGTRRIVATEIQGEGLRMDVDLGNLADDVKLGDSICNAGCCLTVVAIRERVCSFEMGSETLSKTMFANRKLGDQINIERSLKVGDRMGGHFVTGHVDGLGFLVSRTEEGPWSHFRFSAPDTLLSQMVAKGSITIDGVSLTIVDVFPDGFSIALIPHTLSVTTLGQLREGDSVHLETDILAKYAQRSLASLSLESLSRRSPHTT
jgi:riboflavin synthase